MKARKIPDATSRPARGTAGDVFLQWQWPLHSGQAFGMTGRILVFLTRIACPVLYVTGIIRWLRKRKAKAVARDRDASADGRASPSGLAGL
jgi:uncharacterized iron-regulated membrane protein